MFGRIKKTPVTERGLRKYDDLDASQAAFRAWTTPGPHPEWQDQSKKQVREVMPVLARALDRLVEESRK